ncbi:MAG: hypothetical protein Q3M30_15330 [Candidatus Electrothrix sp. Rat3]|nr:hypothetical protein [Candidatus Electrothrix rattekaaiensis]
MYQDEIITEVWKNRDSYTAKHHHSLAEIVADLQTRQKRPGCRIVDRRGQRRSSDRSSSVAAEA